MRLSPGARKLALTAHIACSVGWLGAVVAFLALAITGVTSTDDQIVRAVYIAMEAGAWAVILPLALASLVTGLIQSLGTRWGLFRHYWVLFKLLINLVATVILVLYLQTLGELSDLARSASTSRADVSTPSPVLHAAAAVVLLVVASVLAVYKPRGLTPYGRRRLRI